MILSSPQSPQHAVYDISISSNKSLTQRQSPLNLKPFKSILNNHEHFFLLTLHTENTYFIQSILFLAALESCFKDATHLSPNKHGP